jgi:hypothetical protein
MAQEVKQEFQSEAKLFALKVHAVWVKCENVVLFPFRWLSDQVSSTPAWKRAEGTLRLVK